MKRRIFSLILAIALLISLVPMSAMAQTQSADLNTENLQITGTNDLGEMISQDLSQHIAREGTGTYNVTGLTVEGNVATVEYFAIGEATVVVGIYSEDGLQLLASGTAAVSPDAEEVSVSIAGDMPQYFVATAYLLDNYDNSPLCTAYSTPMYTKEMQDLLASTVDDYDQDKVLNLDQDKTTNFAVYGDSVVVVKATAEQNILESVDTDTNEYLFRKADDALLGLKRGAILAYEDADGELLALRVYSITSDAQRSVLLKGFTPEVEDVFAHVKIESGGDTDDIIVDESTGDPGITYTGRVSDADTAALTRSGIPAPAYEDNAHASLPLGFDLSLKLGNVSLTGSLQTTLTADLSYYITFKRQFISFTLDTNTTLSASVSGEAELLKGRLPELGFAPVPGVFIGFAPEIQVKATGTIAFNAVILRKIGFSYEVGKGSKDLSTPSVVQTDLTVSGVFFVGIDFCPKISILKDSVAAIKLTAPCGVTLTAVLTGTDHGEIAEPEGENGPARVHLCKNCLDIDVSGTFSLALELEFLKSNSLKYTVHFVDAKYHIRDYYYSVDQDDFGTGSCPYGAYRTTVSVLDEAGSGVDKVQVMAKRTSDGQMFQMGTTNPEGVTTEYLTPGIYHFTGTAGDVEYSLSKWIYTAGKVVMEPRPKATQPTMPPYISSVVTTETVKDKTNSKVQETGSCGTNVTYTLYSDGLLEIEGDGDGRISMDAFKDDDRVKSVVIKSGVTRIGYNAFEDNGNLESVVIEEGLSYIGLSAFKDCEYLQSVQLPDSVTVIDSHAFSGCHSLASIQLPSNLKRMGRRAFYRCYDLTGVVIPDSVTEMTELEDGIFAECTSLVSAKLPKDIVELPPYLFYYCENLETVQIPAGVTTIGALAFFGCENLQAVYFTGSQAQWDAITIQDDNDPLKNATIYCNSQSSSEGEAGSLPEVDIQETLPTYEAVYGGRYSTEETETYILKSAKFTGLVPKEEYVVLALAKLETADLLANDNLLAVGQVAADSSGAATFQFVPKLDSSECYIIACGASNRNLAYASISLMEMQAGDTPRAVEPIVTYEGKELVEGRDYELLGQVDYMEAGEYTCYIRGINNYTGLVECTYQVEGAIEKFNIAFANMTLGNSLAMNFAFPQDAMEDWDGCYAKIVKTYADGRANKEVTIPYEDWGAAGIGGVAHFALKFDGVAAKEMSDSVYVTIYDAQGNAISNTWEDSVRGYAMRTLNNPKTSKESAIMVVDLLNYGAAAQEYFKYNQADLANNQMTAAQKALATQDAPAEDIRVKGPNYLGSNLGLESQILMRMAFKGTDTSMYATIEFTNHAGREIKVELEGSEFGATGAITIDEIVIADGRKPVTVTIYNADGTVYASATDSMESYIARMRVDKYDPLFEAILKFSDSAYNFFH